MKPIKLLTLTSWNYVIIFTVLTLLFFGIFFIIIQKEVLNSTDEVLYNREVRILEEIKKNGQIPAGDFRFTDFRIMPVNEIMKIKPYYSDTSIYESVDREWDQFRKLSETVKIGSHTYLLEIVAARMETHEIVSSIIKSLSLVFALMVSAFFFTSRYFFQKLWKPFYTTLNTLNKFEIDQPEDIDLKPVRIEEFTSLNNSITELIHRTRKTFYNQKQFIENASHEMQTPLAITQSKLEQLIDDPSLTEHQSEIIQTLIHSTQRMKRLNKTLLLLSKIDNDQFLEKEVVIISNLVGEIITVFEDQRDALNIKLTANIDQHFSIVGNRTLIDLLITNLVKNALVHNVNNGSLSIECTDKQLKVSNTSCLDAIPNEKLFARFFKNSNRKDSWGLGLAIVYRICLVNGWKIQYGKVSNIHTFTVTFNLHA